MKPLTLEEAKELISVRHLGRNGVHGVGLSQNAVLISSSQELDDDLKRSMALLVAPWGLNFEVVPAPVG